MVRCRETANSLRSLIAFKPAQGREDEFAQYIEWCATRIVARDGPVVIAQEDSFDAYTKWCECGKLMDSAVYTSATKNPSSTKDKERKINQGRYGEHGRLHCCWTDNHAPRFKMFRTNNDTLFVLKANTGASLWRTPSCSLTTVLIQIHSNIVGYGCGQGAWSRRTFNVHVMLLGGVYTLERNHPNVEPQPL